MWRELPGSSVASRLIDADAARARRMRRLLPSLDDARCGLASATAKPGSTRDPCEGVRPRRSWGVAKALGFGAPRLAGYTPIQGGKSLGELWGMMVREQELDDGGAGTGGVSDEGAGACGGAAESLLTSMKIKEAAKDARCQLKLLAKSHGSNVSAVEEVGVSCTLLSAMELLCDWRESPPQEGGVLGDANVHLLAFVEHLATRSDANGCVTPLNSLFFDFSDDSLLSIARAAFDL